MNVNETDGTPVIHAGPCDVDIPRDVEDNSVNKIHGSSSSSKDGKSLNSLALIRPKGYISAFNFFCIENRPNILNLYPGLKVSSPR